MRRVADDDPDAAQFAADAERPEDAEWPVWAFHLRRAWNDLRHDRQMAITGMAGPGGMVLRPIPLPLPWSAVDRYAVRLGLVGDTFDTFWSLVHALDQEYLDFEAEKAKSEKP